MKPKPSTDEEGSVTGFVAVIAIALVFVAGMVSDGGRILAAGLDAAHLAQAAARAGAQEIDLDALRATGQPAIDPVRADQSARDYLAAAGAEGTVTVDANRVTVTVTLTQPMGVLPVPARRVTATRSADATAGVTASGDLP